MPAGYDYTVIKTKDGADAVKSWHDRCYNQYEWLTALPLETAAYALGVLPSSSA